MPARTRRASKARLRAGAPPSISLRTRESNGVPSHRLSTSAAPAFTRNQGALASYSLWRNSINAVMRALPICMRFLEADQGVDPCSTWLRTTRARPGRSAKLVPAGWDRTSVAGIQIRLPATGRCGQWGDWRVLAPLLRLHRPTCPLVHYRRHRKKSASHTAVCRSIPPVRPASGSSVVKTAEGKSLRAGFDTD